MRLQEPLPGPERLFDSSSAVLDTFAGPHNVPAASTRRRKQRIVHLHFLASAEVEEQQALPRSSLVSQNEQRRRRSRTFHLHIRCAEACKDRVASAERQQICVQAPGVDAVLTLLPSKLTRPKSRLVLRTGNPIADV